MKTRTLKVDYLARVEGEGALLVKIKQGQVTDVKLKIFEPPRFFEAFLRGRKFTEAPDITARICGICPIAYQMSAFHAMEDACGVRVEGPLRALRRFPFPDFEQDYEFVALNTTRTSSRSMCSGRMRCTRRLRVAVPTFAARWRGST
jgi:Nickel-dependent hydrogenase